MTAAQKIGGSVFGFVAGSEIKAVAEEASKVKGLDRIIMVENGSYDKVRWIFLTLDLAAQRNHDNR